LLCLGRRAELDDSLLRPAVTYTPGVAWRRDPLAPRFQTNFVRAQRFLQLKPRFGALLCLTRVPPDQSPFFANGSNLPAFQA